jgi:hypothetical protein
MAEQDSVFDRLVAELSSNERRELLLKIEKGAAFSDEPLVSGDEDHNTRDLQREYDTLGWLDKLLIFLQTIFLKKDKLDLTEKILVRQIRAKVEKQVPGVFDFYGESVGGAFCRDVARLRQAAQVFKSALVSGLGNPQNKRDFYAFVGSQFLESFQEQLLKETDPWTIWRNDPAQSVEQVKQTLDLRMDQLFQTLEADERRQIIVNVRALNGLFQFCQFPFESIINFFPQTGDNQYASCCIFDVKEQIKDLVNILYSLPLPPRSQAIKALFLFYFQDAVADRNFDLEPELTSRMNQAREALSFIREFNRKYPLPELMRALTSHINYEIVPYGSGDDWFRIYREFWKERIINRFRIFSQEREKQKKVRELAQVWGLKEISKLPVYRTETYIEAPEILFPYTTAAFYIFFDKIVTSRIFYAMNSVLIDGKFYKKENRKDFEDSYNDFIKLPEKIKGFVGRFEKDGENTEKIQRFRETVAAGSLRNRKIQEIFYNSDRDLKYIFDNIFKLMGKLRNLLEGILSGNGGPYDTLSNLGEIGGGSNRQFQKDLNELLLLLTRSLTCMQEIYTMEADAKTAAPKGAP